jgi:phosphatidylserine/phosphatidylglycerophosphate/cardiolipin synthase-like enzyme
MSAVMLRYIFFLFFTFLLTPSFALEDEGQPDSTPLYAKRLDSDIDHTEFLKQTLNTATKEVMISSYNVSPNRLLREGIGEAIINAAARGIQIYIYYENRPWYSKEDYADLSKIGEHCAKFEENQNHSKCVIKDRDTVAIGSYNWLSDSRKDSFNASMVITGLLTSGLIQDVWQGIRFYQSLKYENTRGVKKFLSDRDAFSTGEYQFAPGQFLYTLRTPEAHEMLLDDVFQKAQARILLFSPFIRLEKLQDTFTPSLLHDLQQRRVNIQLITLPSPCDRVPGEQGNIFSFLNNLRSTYPNFSYRTQPNLHAKTLIADNDLICEGSFNWLSAVSDIDHGANNFEMSVSVRGDIAYHMIQAFEGTALGKSILPIKPKAIEPSPYSKRTRAEQSSEKDKRFKSLSGRASPSFNHLFKIFSGAQCGKEGYCARLNDGDYLRNDRRQILYFKTEEEAREAAQALLFNTQIGEDSDSSLGVRTGKKSLWLEIDKTAKKHLERPIITPTLRVQKPCFSDDLTSAESEEDIYDLEALAEIDRLEQEYFSSQQTSSPESFDESPSSFDLTPITIPTSFDRLVRIFPGVSFGRQGYCARFNDGGYLSDDKGQILYFKTPEIAKQTAYATWKQ